MMKTVLETDKGLRISSGQEGTAILSLSLTQAVNSGEELTLGSVCASVAELQLMIEETCPIAQGDRFRLYKEDGWGRRWCLGVFTAEKPKRNSRYRVSITAYDNVAKLDRDVSAAFAQLTGWPLSAEFLAQWTGEQCGVTLASNLFFGANRLIEPFSGDGITGRQILSFVAEAAGCFGRADKDGKIAFGWYAPNEKISVGSSFQYGIQTQFSQDHLQLTGVPAFSQEEDLGVDVVDAYYDGQGNLYLSGKDSLGCLAGKMSVADYQVPPIDSLQIRQDSGDLGVLYPKTGEHTYRFTGNPFLVFSEDEALSPFVEPMIEKLQAVSYTPMTVTVPFDPNVDVGDILAVKDRDGVEHNCYVMERQISGHTMTLKCTGSGQRETATMASRNIQSLAGKVMRLRTDVDGLQAENADALGNLASMALTISGIEGKVAALGDMQENISTLRQDAKSLALELRTLQENGVDKVVTTTGYTFSDEGLKIKKSGQEMENVLDHTGMTVRRGGNAILQADYRGVTAVDVTVGNFLAVAHARFESFEQGTACFYI